jgi:acetoin utilization protein AcuB
VTLAQSRRVGALLVVENGRVVGIATTNDIFYKIVNPMLGIDQPGIRLSIHKWDGIPSLQKILGIIGRFDANILTFYVMTHPDTGERDLITHMEVSDPVGLIDELRNNGFEVHQRAR